MRRAAVVPLLVLCAGAVAGAQDATVRVRGTVVDLQGNVLTVATATETRRIALQDGLRVVSIVRSDLAKIVPGAYVGSAAVVQPDGTLRAQEVHIFPEAMRGTGDGHRPYDLGPQSTMTNGTVGAAVVESVGGRTITVRYKDGEKTIVVPAGTPVVTYEPGDVKQLTPGAHVYVIAQRAADGTLSTARVNVGKNGLVPPM
jgi:hypothetical protein